MCGIHRGPGAVAPTKRPDTWLQLTFLRSAHPLQTRGGPYMTHQGSAASRCGAPLLRQRVLRREASPAMSPNPATERARAASGTSRVHCHFCARPISEFVRLHWRRSPIRRRVRPGVPQPRRLAESQRGSLTRLGHPSAYVIESQAIDRATTRFPNSVTASPTDSSLRYTRTGSTRYCSGLSVP